MEMKTVKLQTADWEIVESALLIQLGEFVDKSYLASASMLVEILKTIKSQLQNQTNEQTNANY